MNDFVDALPVRVQVVIDNQVERMNLLSPSKPHLPFPHSSQIEGELRELRCHYGSTLYRILYRRSRNLLILLHMLRKDSGRIPAEDILIAKRRWDDFRARWTLTGGCHREPPAMTPPDRDMLALIYQKW